MAKVIGMNPRAKRWYTPLAGKTKDSVEAQYNTPEEDRLVIEHTMLTLEQKAELDDDIIMSITDSGDQKTSKSYIKTGTRERRVLEFCVVGWKNLVDEKGDNVPFNQDKLDYLPPEFRANIVGHILGTLESEKKEADKNLG